jgi:hypothetical protein
MKATRNRHNEKIERGYDFRKQKKGVKDIWSIGKGAQFEFDTIPVWLI